MCNYVPEQEKKFSSITLKSQFLFVQITLQNNFSHKKNKVCEWLQLSWLKKISLKYSLGVSVPGFKISNGGQIRLSLHHPTMVVQKSNEKLTRLFDSG